MKVPSIKILREKCLGKHFILSAIGLRKMANYLEKKYKTDGEVEVKVSIFRWKVDREHRRTIHIE